MNKLIQLFSTKTFPWIIALLLLTIPAISDLLRPGYFSMHDDFQLMRQIGIDQCLNDGQIPCRWIPDAGFGFGYPMFNYYPPLPYYLGQVFLLTPLNIFWVSKLTFILAIILSGLFMFILAREFFGRAGGFLAAIFYLYAPYHSVDVYVRGALNEAFGLVWFPLIFYAAYRLIKSKSKLPSFILLAVSYAALLLSHNVMTLIFTPLLGLWCLFWLFYTKNFRSFFPLLLSGLFAIALAAFFFLPVALESSQVHVETMTVGYFNYLAHYADIKQMLFSRFWGYGASTWGPEDGMPFPVGHFQWFIGGVVIGLASFIFLLKRLLTKSTPSNFSFYLLSLWLLPVTAFYIFLIHSRSVWFWDNLPLLGYAQFPWRLLAIPAFTLSFLCGGVILILKKLPSKIYTFLFLLLLFAVIAWNLPYFKIEKPLLVTPQEKFDGILWERQTTGGIFDYLPKTASRPPGTPAPTQPLFIKGDGAILDFISGTNWEKFTAKVSTDSTISLPLYNYPIWKITANDQPISYYHESDTGTLRFDLSPGEYTIDVRLTNTPIRTLSNLISLFAFILLLSLISKQKQRLLH